METLAQTTVGELVARNFRTAAVFSHFGIDFCCKGGRTLQEACDLKGINMVTVEANLMDLLEKMDMEQEMDYKGWSLDLLADYIQKVHHTYVEEKVPVLLAFLEKLCRVHGAGHPELLKIKDLFETSAGELTRHMKKEELILFPFIKKMVAQQKAGNGRERPFFGSIENPITGMMQEHDQEGERFSKIAELSNVFTAPPDACNTYRVTYSMLDEFVKDLHKHIHLENNILFPGALTMERRHYGKSVRQDAL